MKILHLNAGNETGGGMHHILKVLGKLNELYPDTCYLGLLEKKELYERARSANIHTIHFQTHYRYTPSLIRKVVLFIRDNGITHVHSHGPRANVYMNFIKRFVHITWITTIHSDPFNDFKDGRLYGKLLEHLHLQAIKQTTKIICVSRTFQSKLKSSGCHDQLQTIHNGIEFHKPLADNMQINREQLGFSDDDFLILQVARLHPVKAHHIAFKALKQAIAAHKRVYLMLIGDGPLKERLKKLAAELDIISHVYFLGEKLNVYPYYGLADVTLLTSVSESFPYVLLESAQMKTPVITTDTGDIGHLINGKDVGWKLPINDIEGITEAILEAVRFKGDKQLGMLGENCICMHLHIFH